MNVRVLFFIFTLVYLPPLLGGSVMARPVHADILQAFSEGGSKRFTGESLLEWAYANIKIRVGGDVVPFTLKGHEPLRELYTLEKHPHVVARKAAQVAVSTQNIIRTFYLADRYSMKVGYYFPTDDDVQDFVYGRVNTIVDDSDHLAGRMKSSRTDNVGVKLLGKSAIYFRGVWTKRKVKSIDLDYIIKDEVDEGNQENLKFAEDRLFHSKFGWIAELSQPSIDDYGIDASFKKGDMRFFAKRCVCGHWNFPDKTWPDCLMTRGRATYIGCVKCARKLHLESGEWVPEHPDRSKDIRSYHISHLIFPHMDPAKIKRKFEDAKTTIEKKNFSISVLGMPYASANSKPITDAVLNDAQRDTGFVHEARFSYFGMDVGDKCHLVFGHPYNGKPRIHFVAEMPADDEAGIIWLMKRMGVYSGVIDAMPYKTLAKNIARAFPGRVFINYYKGDTLKTSEEGEGQFAVPKVSVNRDESLDETVEALAEGRIELPDPRKLSPEDTLAYEEFRAQTKMLIKEAEDKNGVIEYHYKKNVPNHYGMALNYMRIAAELSSLNLVSGVDPIGVSLI